MHGLIAAGRRRTDYTIGEFSRLNNTDGEGPTMNTVRAAVVAVILAAMMNPGLAADPPEPLVSTQG